MPRRIQRKRTKGWRLPEGVVYVGRPTKWGNPFGPGTSSNLVRIPAVHHPDKPWEYEGRISAANSYHPYFKPGGEVIPCTAYEMTREQSVQCYTAWLNGGGWPIDWAPRRTVTPEMAREELADKDLACWCNPNQPCHADVLLEIANAEDSRV